MIGGTTIRFSGLASGMDTDQIIKDLLAVRSAKLNKLQQAKTINSWKTDAYREMNIKVASLRDTMSELRLQGTFNASKLSSGDESKLGVTVTGTPTQASYEISNISLAQTSTASTVKFFTKNIASDGINPEVKEIGATTTKLSDLGVKTDSGADLTTTSGTITLNINNQDIIINADANTTVQNVLDAINNSTAGVKASYSATDKSFTLTQTTLGSTNDVVIADPTTSTNVLRQLGMQSGSILNNTYSGTDVSYAAGKDARDASITINGIEHRSSTNTLTVDGIKFELRGEMTTGSFTLTKSADTDKIFDKIKTFVDKYNELVLDLRTKINERKDRQYQPLTDEQRKELTEDEVKKWEERAKQGLLANDPIASKLLNHLRSSFGDSIQVADGPPPVTVSLSDIGITTSTNYRDGGKLVLNEDKLKAALQGDMEKVKQIFTSKFDTANSTDTTLNNSEEYLKSGIGYRAYDMLNFTNNEIGAKAINSNNTLIKESRILDNQISNEQSRLRREEDRLYKQFTAMEKALQNMNSQSAWLTQQLGG